jgi:D-alanyl-D-alanine carboxypeptidase
MTHFSPLRNLFSLFLVVTALSLAGCSTGKTDHPERDAATAELQGILDEAIETGMPGISAAIATSEGIVWTGTAGLANIQDAVSIEKDMLFGIGSITKTFVNVVILQLAEEGRLDLDATASSILGSAVDGIPNADKATIAQLLNHTGGVPSWEDDPLWIREGRGDALDVNEIWGKTQTLPYIKGHEPLFEPGERHSYANTNYTLLGMIIEEVTGRDAVAEIHDRILNPLGLENIYLEGFEDVPAGQLPHRYHWATDKFREDAGINAAFTEVRPDLMDATGSNLSVEWTAGGMVASATDLALYGAALRDGILLEPESMAFMQEWFPVREGRWVGHNVFKSEYPDGVVTIGHSGDVLGFNGGLYWVEGQDAVIVVLGNVGAMHSGRVPITAASVARKREFLDAALKLAAAKR